ncbi:MAG: hypothetical protein ACOWWR_09990 [Eubacteriales bacterium]
MPTPITPEITSGLKGMLSTFRRNIEWVRMESWLLCGIEIHSGEKLAVLYTGVSINKNYFAGVLFGSDYKEKYFGRGHIRKHSECFDKNREDFSIVITEGLKIFGKRLLNKGYFYIPGWVQGHIDLPDDYSDIFKNRRIKRDLNRIKRINYSYEVTRDNSDFNKFYFDMYLPLIQCQHGEAAIIRTYDDMHRKFKKCSLVIIKKDNEAIAGAMVSWDGIHGKWWYVGVLEGKSEYIHEGVLQALYYYPFEFLHKQGCRRIDMGIVRSFLNDGVMCYKKKWGYKIENENPAGYFLKILENSPGTRSFLYHNPYVVTGKDGNSAVFFDETENCTEDLLDRVRYKFLPEGLDWIIIQKINNDASISRFLKIPLTNDS